MGNPGTKFKVFVVEDEAMISMVIEDTVEMLGYQMVGPVAQLDEALTLYRDSLIRTGVPNRASRGT